MNRPPVRPSRQVLIWLVVDLGLNDLEIARLCKVTSKTVRVWRHLDGIARRPRPRSPAR